MPAIPRFGLGFRTQHLAELCAAPGGADWLEVLSDNYLSAGGPRRAQLERLRRDFPLALHGVGLGIANDAPPAPDYLARLRGLADWIEPTFVSDHLCWTGLDGRTSHDLLPVAYTREVLALVAERVAHVQDRLGRRLLLENATAYVAFRGEEIAEADFLAALCERTGCGVLLDVNNLHVNACNLGIDPARYVAALAPEHVGYLHVAGHAVLPDVRIDTHGSAVPSDVWALFRAVAARFPHAHVIVERDDDVPPLGELLRELDAARACWREAAGSQPRPAPAPFAPSTPEAAVNAPARSWAAAQRDFWERCVDRPVRFRHAELPGLGALVDDARPVPAERGMRVYSDAYAKTLERALAASFPALARVLSPRDFAALCAAFAAAHPPRAHDSVSFGGPLPDFVRSFAFADDYGVPREALADLAHLEHAQLEVQEAADEDARVAPEALVALSPEDWERLRVRFAPAHRVVRAAHDVLPAVRAVAQGRTPDRPAPTTSAYLVSRRDGAVATDAIDAYAASSLEYLASGKSFAEVCAALGGADGARTAATALALACARGAIVALSLPPHTSARSRRRARDGGVPQERR